jgi:hypothetical protein
MQQGIGQPFKTQDQTLILKFYMQQGYAPSSTE